MRIVSDGEAGLFPGYFMAGFECSTPINSHPTRIDEVQLTGHDRHVRADYRRLRSLGIYVARDGIGWDKIDCNGKLDFAPLLPFVEAAEEERVTIIWDMFHYGYPDDLDPFEPSFKHRFTAYCHAFAKLLVKRGQPGPRFYTPVNEISFFSWAGGDQGIFSPHARDRGFELKYCLAAAAIAGIDAIRSADPTARIVNCDPLCRVVAPLDAPWLEEGANAFNECAVPEAWDMLAGRVAPELGGSMTHLDILGVNYYGVNQWEHTRPDSVLAADDARRKPLSELLIWLYQRYRAPMILSETASTGDDRPSWLEKAHAECRKAIRKGVDLKGFCIYPIVGMADWHSLEFLPMGLWDLHGPSRRRILHRPTADVLRRLQQPYRSEERLAA